MWSNKILRPTEMRFVEKIASNKVVRVRVKTEEGVSCHQDESVAWSSFF